MKEIKEKFNVTVRANGNYGVNINSEISIKTPSVAELIASVVGEKVLVESLGSTHRINLLLQTQKELEEAFDQAVGVAIDTIGEIEQEMQSLADTLYDNGYEDGREDGYNDGYSAAENEFSE